MLSVDQESRTTTTTPSPDPPPSTSAPSELVDLPPNFSIRDYVLASRSKDIKDNWPFSLKSLRLCLKHGFKDVLPPFHTLRKLKDRSVDNSTVGTSSSEKHSTSLFEEEEEEEASRPVTGDDVFVPDPSHVAPLNTKKLAESCPHVSSSKAGEDKDFPPSTITSVSQSELESLLVPGKKQSRSAPSKRGTSSKSSCELEAAGPTPAQKTEGTSRPLGRKCRLLVKLGVQSGRCSTEDISSNCALNTATETMASKVCPVCKNFSSSSNTTLNAHIDQCLSTESTSLYTAGSKIARHRIKPRRMRLMVDIYASAQACTLEDLDRRNGTNWSLIASLPTRETEKTGTSVERKKKSVLPVHRENASSDVGPVYIDTNGTKVRILSKLNSPAPPASEAGDDTAGKGPFNGNKCISKQKKKHVMQQHQKYLKLAPRSRKDFSRKVQGFQMRAGQDIHINEQMDGKDAHQVPNRVQSADSGTFKPWLCSKRRDFTKKIRSQATGQTVRCKWHLPQHLLVDRDQSFPGVSVKNHGPEIANVPGSVVQSSEIYRRKDKISHNAQVSQVEGHGRKRVESSSVTIKKRHTDLLSEDRTLIKGNHMVEPSVSAGNLKSSPSKKLDGIRKEAFYVAAKTTGSSRAIVTKARRFSSFRKNILSVGNRCPNTKSGHSKIKKAPALSKYLLYAIARKDNQMAQYSVIDQDESEQENGGAVDERSGANFAALELCFPGPCIKVQSNFRCLSSRSKSLNISAEPEFDDDQHVFCGDEAASDVVGHNNDLPVTIEPETCQENSFQEVDPISIPGPPGSYLPSPRGMSSEDFQGNSSFNTSRVHSFVDLPEVVDGDSSDSPISIASTISNSNLDAGKYVEKYFDAKAGVIPIAYQDRIGSRSAGTDSGPLMQNGGPVPQITSPVVDKPYYIGGYKSDHPCCCQRKERFTRDVCLNHEESQLLRRRKLSCLTVPATEKQVGHNAIAIQPKLDGRPEFLHPATSESENLARPMTAGSSLSNDSPDLGARLFARADCDSASPASNPILRLMGKNLMVVSKDGASSIAREPVQTTPSTNHSISQNVHRSCQLPSGPAVPPPAYNPHQNALGFHRIVSGSPIVFNGGPRVVGHYDVGLAASCRTLYDLRPQPQEVVPSWDQHHQDYAFGASLGLSEHKGHGSVGGLQNSGSRNRQSPPDQQSKYAAARDHPVKEIIIIDDCSESESSAVVHDGVEYREGWRGTRQAAVPCVIPMSTTQSYDPSRRACSISCFQPAQRHPLHSEAAAVQDANIPGDGREGSRSESVRQDWDRIPEGASRRILFHPPHHPPHTA